MFTIAPRRARASAALGLAAEEDAVDVDVEHLLELREGHVLGGGGVGDAGRVDRERERAERVLDRGDGGADRVRVGHVGRDAECAFADRLDGLARVVEVHAADGGAGLGQSERDLAPNAGGGAGHERDLVFESEGRQHVRVSPRRAGH